MWSFSTRAILSLMNVTCGKVLRPCRGDREDLGRKENLGRRFALPQAILHYPSWVEM